MDARTHARTHTDSHTDAHAHTHTYTNTQPHTYTHPVAYQGNQSNETEEKVFKKRKVFRNRELVPDNWILVREREIHLFHPSQLMTCDNVCFFT